MTGRTLLHYAALMGYDGLATFLLERNKELAEVPDFNGLTGASTHIHTHKHTHAHTQSHAHAHATPLCGLHVALDKHSDRSTFPQLSKQENTALTHFVRSAARGGGGGAQGDH